MDRTDRKERISCLCEYMENPIGIDCESPRITWSAEALAGKQKAYRLLCGLEEQMEKPIWDSGIIHETASNQAKIPAGLLRSGRGYWYRIELLLEEEEAEGIAGQEKPWWEKGPVCRFFTGILADASNVKAAGDRNDDKTPEGGSSRDEEQIWARSWVGGAGLRNHSYLLRFPFTVPEGVKDGAAFIASPNYYAASVDGRPLTEAVLAPAFTDPAKTVLYDTYPLSLCPGEHVLGLEIGNGWHAMELGERHVAKNEHIAAIRICLNRADGESLYLASSAENCFVTSHAPSVYNSIYFGETRDERLAQPGFDTPGFVMRKEDGWARALAMDGPDGKLAARGMEPIVIRQERKPQKIYVCPDGSYTADFGQNFAGWVRIRASGKEGDRIVLRFAELINEDHTINDSSLNGSHATDTFIFGRTGTCTFEPKFTWHGFRYVQIEGLDHMPDAEALCGCVISSDVKRISTFSSDNEGLNWYYEAMLWTEQSNLHGIPSDCPQRAERVAWLNDMTVRNECALYHYRLAALYRKWTRDIRDTQGFTGAIADTAPYFRNGQKPADPVSSSFLMVPWNVYCHYGDRRILRENVDDCARWVWFVQRHSDEGIVRYSPMGDWASPKKWCDPNSIGAGSVSAITPPVYMATGFAYLNCCLMEKMLTVLGRQEEAESWRGEARKAKAAFRRAYAHEDGNFGTGSQGCNAFALWLGMAEEKTGEADRTAAHLVADLKKNDMHLTTGNLCSRFVIEVLFDRGYVDEAVQVLTQKTYPGWGFMKENGATTLWERWEKVDSYHGVSKMASHNHAMSGAAAIVLHKYLLGITVDEQHPGFERFRVRPQIPQALKRAGGSIQTLRGQVGCRWEKTEEGIHLEVDVPFGSEAEIVLPAFDESGRINHRGKRTVVRKGTGCWRFDLKRAENTETGGF